MANKVELILTDGSHSQFFSRSYDLYTQAFPSIERREKHDHLAATDSPFFKPCAIAADGEFVGIAFYWESDKYIYLEHLAIEKDKRGNGYGGAALDLLQQKNKILVLEIEPPELGEYETKRKAFYENKGFFFNADIRHVQLKYRKDDDDCILRIMSYPRPITQDEYAEFNAFLHAFVTNAEM